MGGQAELSSLPISKKMPSYECAMFLKALDRPGTFNILKRASMMVLNNGGVLRNVESLGCNQSLPIKMYKDDTVHKKAHIFLMRFDAPVEKLDLMRAYFREDRLIVRARIMRREVELDRPSTC